MRNFRGWVFLPERRPLALVCAVQFWSPLENFLKRGWRGKARLCLLPTTSLWSACVSPGSRTYPKILMVTYEAKKAERQEEFKSNEMSYLARNHFARRARSTEYSPLCDVWEHCDQSSSQLPVFLVLVVWSRVVRQYSPFDIAYKEWIYLQNLPKCV